MGLAPILKKKQESVFGLSSFPSQVQIIQMTIVFC